MGLVTVDESVIYTWVYAVVAVVTILVVVLIIWGITKFRTPKAANNLTKASHSKLPLILLLGLDHLADLFPLRNFIPEVLESFPFGKGVKKRQFRFVLPQQVNVGDVQVQGGKDAEFTAKVIKSLNDLNTEKVFLRGVNSPILVGVTNRAIAASMPFLGALNWLKDLEQIYRSSKVIEALKKSKSTEVRDLGDLLSRMATGVSAIDFRAVLKYVDINWDHTIQDSISERDKTDGRREGREDKDKATKTVMLLIMAAIAFAIILVVVSKVL